MDQTHRQKYEFLFEKKWNFDYDEKIIRGMKYFNSWSTRKAHQCKYLSDWY